MTKYEAEYVKQFVLDSKVVTAQVKIARAVNCSWSFSAHWKEETWVEQAREDCLIRIDRVTKDLAELNSALRLIESILENEKQRKA